MKRTSLALPFALFLTACGAAPLAPKFAPPPTPSQAQVAANIAQAEPRKERPVVVALRADAPALCAWDLAGTPLWEVKVEAKSAPLVVGNAVVLQEAEGIAVRDLGTGRLRLMLDRDGTLVGADAVEDAVAITIAYTEGAAVSRGEVVFVVGNELRWEKALNQPVGTPALVSHQVLVPWATQRLSVLSADDGSELARWTFRNVMLGQALVDRGRVYVGQHGLLRVDRDLPDRQEGPVALLSPQKRVLPGQPPLLRDGYAPQPAPEHASHKIKLDWRVSPAETPAVEADSAVFRFYRVAFGLTAQRDEVGWARVFEHDLVGSSIQAGGAFLVDDQGSLRFVDAHGVTRMKRELGKKLRVATLRPGELIPAASEPELERPAGTLHDQLLGAAQLDDDRLHPARAFAIQQLAKLPDAGVTRELIALCSHKPGKPQAAQLAACDELGKREGKPEDILEGLRQKASFLEDTAEPPVGALARAAARIQLKQAAPLILSHAEDPHTAPADLVALFAALEALEVQAAIPQLERFVRLHHAEPAGSDLAPALSSALSVLANLRAKSARATLEYVAADALSLEPVRQKAKDALAVLDTPLPKREVAKPAPAPSKAKEAAPVPVEVQTDPRPYALDAEAVQKVLRPLHAGLTRCLEADPGKPKSMRVAMIVAGSGRTEGFVVTPTSLQGCADPMLRAAQFPATRLMRQHVHHTVYAPGAE
jgi:hypothetical protein